MKSRSSAAPLSLSLTISLAISLTILLGFLPVAAQEDVPWEDIPADEVYEEELEEQVIQVPDDPEPDEDESDEPEEPREPKGPWKPRPYFNPLVSAALFSSATAVDAGAYLGAEAGLRYAQENGQLQGRTRVAGSFIATTGGFGNDIRVGTFMGVRPKLAGIEFGLDVFRNEYSGSAVVLPRTLGVDFPSVQVVLGPEQVHLIGGASPTWMDDESRHVDWSQVDTFGFGHEFQWLAGLTVRATKLSLSGYYYQRTVAGGVSEGLAFGIGL